MANETVGFRLTHSCTRSNQSREGLARNVGRKMGGQKQGNDPGDLMSFGKLASSANVALPPATQGNPNSQLLGCTTDFRLPVVTDDGLASRLGSPSNN